MQKKVIFLFLALIAAFPAFSQQMVFRGVYKGKNLIIKNTYNKDSSNWCTQQVSINNHPFTSDFQKAVYIVDLSYLNLNDTFLLAINYKGAQPKILNQGVADRDWFILRKVEQHKEGFRYYTLNENANDYYRINVFDAAGNILDSLDFNSKAHKNMNRYKIKLHDPYGQLSYNIIRFSADGTKEVVYQLDYPVQNEESSRLNETTNENY